MSQFERVRDHGALSPLISLYASEAPIGLGAFMRCLSVATAVATCAVAFTQIASAADLPAKAPPPPPAPIYNWTGFYLGASVGGGWGHQDLNYATNDPATAFTLLVVPDFLTSQSFNMSGALGGFQLGYNYQIDRHWLLGIETDFNWTDIKGSTSSPVFVARDLLTSSEKIKWFGTVRARLGVLPVDSLLAFVTGGFAYGNVERSGNYGVRGFGATLGTGNAGFGFDCVNTNPSGAPFTCFNGSSSDTEAGWTLGGGLEYAIWQKWTVKVEYLYVRLEGKTVTEFAPVVPGFLQSSYNANFSHTIFNVAHAGLNYRF
jgi:outer membrane immunogenic protein